MSRDAYPSSALTAETRRQHERWEKKRLAQEKLYRTLAAMRGKHAPPARCYKPNPYLEPMG